MSRCHDRRNDWGVFKTERVCKKFDLSFKFVSIGLEGLPLPSTNGFAPPKDCRPTVREKAAVVSRLGHNKGLSSYGQSLGSLTSLPTHRRVRRYSTNFDPDLLGSINPTSAQIQFTGLNWRCRTVCHSMTYSPTSPIHAP